MRPLPTLKPQHPEALSEQAVIMIQRSQLSHDDTPAQKNKKKKNNKLKKKKRKTFLFPKISLFFLPKKKSKTKKGGGYLRQPPGSRSIRQKTHSFPLGRRGPDARGTTPLFLFPVATSPSPGLMKKTQRTTTPTRVDGTQSP